MYYKIQAFNSTLICMKLTAINSSEIPLFWIQTTVESLIKDAKHPKTEMFLVSSCSCLCPIQWSQVLSREWRCSWSRRCSNYIWVIDNFIAYWSASYIRDLTVLNFLWFVKNNGLPFARFYCLLFSNNMVSFLLMQSGKQQWGPYEFISNQQFCKFV